jgi:predicted MFS family arabinose efflux permease
MSFAVSQVAGIPIGLYLANLFNWHAPFLLLVGLSLFAMVFMMTSLKPVTKHLAQKSTVSPLVHLQKTVTTKAYFLPFLTMALLTVGGFLVMPFSTPFLINNVGVSQTQLPGIYVIMGVCSMIVLPLIGKLCDRYGTYSVFLCGTILAIFILSIYVNMTPGPLWQVILISALMFTGVMSRMIPSQALMTAVPNLKDRGAFMSINSSLQQVAGGVATVIAGWIIVQKPNGQLLHFDILGYLCIGVMILCAYLMYLVTRQVAQEATASVIVKTGIENPVAERSV